MPVRFICDNCTKYKDVGRWTKEYGFPAGWFNTGQFIICHECLGELNKGIAFEQARRENQLG